MAYLLDTNIYIYLTKGHAKIRQKIGDVGDENIYFSSLSVAEIYYGIFKSVRYHQTLNNFQKNLEKLQVLNFNKNTAKIFGRLKAECEKNGSPVEDFDLAIASIAIHHQHILVTNNTRNFEIIRELTIEDWS